MDYLLGSGVPSPVPLIGWSRLHNPFLISGDPILKQQPSKALAAEALREEHHARSVVHARQPKVEVCCNAQDLSEQEGHGNRNTIIPEKLGIVVKQSLHPITYEPKGGGSRMYISAESKMGSHYTLELNKTPAVLYPLSICTTVGKERGGCKKGVAEAIWAGAGGAATTGALEGGKEGRRLEGLAGGPEIHSRAHLERQGDWNLRKGVTEQNGTGAGLHHHKNRPKPRHGTQPEVATIMGLSDKEGAIVYWQGSKQEVTQPSKFRCGSDLKRGTG
ncbi:hypothetical protein OBBRIDRAFT_807599 [Obba rivulosa]|uniref:Uncharacterized protein n=1 Tax=Obba rivulosa TaxID=1052685 RepID=A0A8E2DGZ1_9APHY|nr:hypothetical protein OBBRIDRAFT_807599 [Obba rivulosa]